MIIELAPLAVTAWVTPVQITAANADTAAALPATVNDVVAALSKFAAIAALMGNTGAAATSAAAQVAVDPAPGPRHRTAKDVVQMVMN